MSYTSRFGNNIRCLRTAYGETQEQLGLVIGVEKTTISQYENGKREPSIDVLGTIAEHYVISVEELKQCDLSGVKKITVDQTALWKEIDDILPIVASDAALKNSHFEKAYSLHHKMFDDLKKLNMDGFDVMDTCFEEYIIAYEDDSSRFEASANIWGIAILFLAMLKMAPQVIKKKTAPLMQTAGRDKKVERIVEEPDPSLERETYEILQDLDDTEIDEKFTEIKTALKTSSSYYGIADYYLALEYCWNLVDNELGREFNARIGGEMMNAFIGVGNSYAARFIIFLQRAMGLTLEFTNRERQKP